MLPLLFLLALVSTVCWGDEGQTIFGKLKSGFEFAGKMLGIDRTKSVAKLVSEAFGKARSPKGEGDQGGNIFSGFLRVLGLDSKRIGAIAVNAIIFVAQLISSSLPKPGLLHLPEARSGSPFDWMMNFTAVANMVDQIKDRELPNRIIVGIKEHSMDEETDCVQLLVCKSAPFIWGMQRALNARNEAADNSSDDGVVKRSQFLYRFMPGIDDVVGHGEGCEKEHPYCFIGV